MIASLVRIFHQRRPKTADNQKGVVLVTAIILMVVGSILAASILSATLAELKQVEYAFDGTQAQVYARSALQTAIVGIQARITELEDIRLEMEVAAEVASEKAIQSAGSGQAYEEWEAACAYFAVYKAEYEAALSNFETQVIPIYGITRSYKINNLLPVASGGSAADNSVEVTVARDNDYRIRLTTSPVSMELGGSAVAEAFFYLASPTDAQYSIYTTVVDTTTVESTVVTQTYEGFGPYRFTKVIEAYQNFNMRNSVSVSGSITYHGQKNPDDPPTIVWVAEPANDPFYKNRDGLDRMINRYPGHSMASTSTLPGSVSNTDSARYGDAVLSGTMNVYTHGGDVYLYMTSLTVMGNSTINVTGAGNLYILITGDNGTVLSAPDGLNIRTYLGSEQQRVPHAYIISYNENTTGQVRIGGGSSQLGAYWYAPTCDLYLQHDEGSQGTYSGAIIGRDITLSRASLNYVNAPAVLLPIDTTMDYVFDGYETVTETVYTQVETVRQYVIQSAPEDIETLWLR